ncbi:hypothetical protein [Levilactobacillus yonginensis]|uniref:hypothetical protein n=1 Tax=Levilactobacillus yonginensis TaxID=1054041 RepID=UPI00345CD68A
MLNFFEAFSLISFIIIPVAIIWALVSLKRHHKLKVPLLALLTGVILMALGFGLAYLPIFNTQLSLNKSTIKTDSDGYATVRGEATPGSIVEIQSNVTSFDDYVKTNKSGFFEDHLLYYGGHKEHVYTASAGMKGRYESPDKTLTVIDTTYAPKERARKKIVDKDDSSNLTANKEDQKAFEQSVNELATNASSKLGISNSISAKFNNKDSEVTFYLPDSATSLSKKDKKTIATYLFSHTEKLAALSDIDAPTTQFIQTKDYDNIARTTVTGGIKIY